MSLLLSALAVDAQDDSCFIFDGGDPGKIVIYGEIDAYGKPCPRGNLVVPEFTTSIGDEVFRDRGIVSLSLPATVTSIGDNAFRDNALATLVLHEGVTDVGYGAFADNALVSLDLPKSLVSVGVLAFAHNELTRIDLPERPDLRRWPLLLLQRSGLGGLSRRLGHHRR